MGYHDLYKIRVSAWNKDQGKGSIISENESERIKQENKLHRLNDLTPRSGGYASVAKARWHFLCQTLNKSSDNPLGIPLDGLPEEEPKLYAPISKQRRQFYHGGGKSKFTKKENEEKLKEKDPVGYESETEKTNKALLQRSLDWNSYNRIKHNKTTRERDLLENQRLTEQLVKMKAKQIAGQPLHKLTEPSELEKKKEKEEARRALVEKQKQYVQQGLKEKQEEAKKVFEKKEEKRKKKEELKVRLSKIASTVQSFFFNDIITR